MSTVPVCVVNDSPCNAANPDLRVIHQIPNRILHIVPIDNLATVGTTSNHILQDDPFHKVHVLGVVDGIIEFLPVPNYSSIIPSPEANFSLFVQAKSVESIAVQREVTLHLETIQCPIPTPVCTIPNEVWEVEVLLIDSFNSTEFIAFPLALHRGVRCEVAGT